MLYSYHQSKWTDLLRPLCGLSSYGLLSRVVMGGPYPKNRVFEMSVGYESHYANALLLPVRSLCVANFMTNIIEIQ